MKTQVAVLSESSVPWATAVDHFGCRLTGCGLETRKGVSTRTLGIESCEFRVSWQPGM